jgi:hypothetical protein
MNHIANHLGWETLDHDTYQGEHKFNIWHIYEPPAGKPREAKTRAVKLRAP